MKKFNLINVIKRNLILTIFCSYFHIFLTIVQTGNWTKNFNFWRLSRKEKEPFNWSIFMICRYYFIPNLAE